GLAQLRVDQSQLRTVSLLGQGSFSDVWKGVLNGSQPVSIKKMKAGVLSEPKVLDIFFAELKIWAPLRHPNILSLLAFSFSANPFSADPPMLAAELCDGSLRDVMDARRWPPALGWKFIRDVASALVYLHNRSIRHGDVKSANILISGSNFVGIQTTLTGRLQLGKRLSFRTSARRMAGTPSFMAPELWEGGFVGAEADVYALAMTCWEVAEEGEFPFMGLGGFSGIREAVAAGIRPNRPSSLPDSLWKLMQQMWAQEPEDRPTAAKVVQELDRIL
ncbi:kinase-like domain-containing protein, partial [Hyaloraphidium curvatum]